jgi:hypothetical protein
MPKAKLLPILMDDLYGFNMDEYMNSGSIGGDTFRMEKGVSFVSNILLKNVLKELKLDFKEFKVSNKTNSGGFNLNLKKQLNKKTEIGYKIDDDTKVFNLKYKLTKNLSVELENTTDLEEETNSVYFTFEN